MCFKKCTEYFAPTPFWNNFPHEEWRDGRILVVIFITYVAVQHCVFRGTNSLWFSLPCVLWTIYKFRCFFVRYVWLLVVSLNTFLFPMISLSTVMKAASGRARWPFYYGDANSVSSSELMVSKSFLPFEIGLTWFSSSRYEVVCCS